MSTIAEKPARLAPSLAAPVADHVFVSNVRFLSMAAVVFVHCITGFFWQAGFRSEEWLERGMRQPVSFDVIGFFLISGFLMEEGLARRSPAEYLKRRIRRIVPPWLFWFSLYYSISLVNDIMHDRLNLLSWRDGIHFILHGMVFCLFTSAYWFVPNLLIALCILLFFRRFLFDFRMGLFLLALSIFYGLDIYGQWIHLRNHTAALFGFVFYLWLGQWAARNFAMIQRWSSRISTPALLAVGTLAGLGALMESTLLFAAGNPFPMNTLRICNQVYAIVLVFAIFKLRMPVWPRWFNVRATTFGIYLIHPVILWFLKNVSRQFVSHALTGESRLSASIVAVCLTLCAFVFVYGCSLLLTKWLLGHPRLRWIVGAPLSN